MATVLKNISEIRRFFHRNEEPVYFISATNFNLLGLDEWVKNFKYICYIDCYGGKHPNVFCPSEQPHAEFQSIEDINNYLLQHKEVIDFIKRRGGKPKFVFLMFDEETERLSKELGADVWFPKAKLREKWQAGPQKVDLETFVQRGLEKYDGSIRRKLIWGVYVIPVVVIATIIYLTNFS